MVHADHPDDPGRHYHYVRDQLIVGQDDLGDLRRALRTRAGVDVQGSLDELGLALVQLQGARAPVPELVDELHGRRGRAALWASPNHVIGPCTHVHLSGSIPQPTADALAPAAAGVSARAGTGVTVAVLDSGAVLDHAWFAGRVSGDLERPELDPRGRLQCNSGHGTFVAGVVLAHAPAVRVAAYRVFDEHMTVNDVTVARRLLDLATSDARVVNLSIGGYTHDDLGMVAVSAALRHLFERRPALVVVAAAGNDATDKPCHPAADHRVIAVGAVGRDGSGRWRRACFSNHGPWWMPARRGWACSARSWTTTGRWSPTRSSPSASVGWGGGPHALGTVHRLGALERDLVHRAGGGRADRGGHRRGAERARGGPPRPPPTRRPATGQPGNGRDAGGDAAPDLVAAGRPQLAERFGWLVPRPASPPLRRHDPALDWRLLSG